MVSTPAAPGPGHYGRSDLPRIDPHFVGFTELLYHPSCTQTILWLLQLEPGLVLDEVWSGSTHQQ